MTENNYNILQVTFDFIENANSNLMVDLMRDSWYIKDEKGLIK